MLFGTPGCYCNANDALFFFSQLLHQYQHPSFSCKTSESTLKIYLHHRLQHIHPRYLLVKLKEVQLISLPEAGKSFNQVILLQSSKSEVLASFQEKRKTILK